MIDLPPHEFESEMQLLWTDPAKYVAMKSEEIARDPHNADAFFSRHQGWLWLGKLDEALADINAAIALKQNSMRYVSRGLVWCRIGRYRDALDDFDRAEAFDPQEWPDLWGPLYQADCHSRIGNEAEAIAACEKLKDDFWSPGLDGTPAGNKQEIIAEVRRRLGASILD